ncbi:MAG: hypothetical protein ACLQVF_11070 [Isosphaeraceae bacterium]
MMPRLLAVAAGAIMLVLAGFASPMAAPVRGGADLPPRSDHAAQPAAPASRSDFVAEIRRILTIEQDRMIELASRVFRHQEDVRQLEDQLAGRKFLVEAARARYEKAKLGREVAEIRVREFTEGTFVQELALAEGELKIAEEEIATSRAETKREEEQLARIKQASTGSVFGMSIEFQIEGKLEAAKLGERRAGYAREQAESKKKVLVGYTKQHRHKELLSDVEKSRSDELSAQATLEMELAKTKRLEREVKQNDLPPDLKRTLVLLDQAIAVQEEIRRKLDDAAKQGNVTDVLRKDIRDQISRLTALVDAADGERAALLFDKLKPRIHQAADGVRAKAK